MKIMVQKFGGTSVAGPERMRKVLSRVRQGVDQGFKMIVVLSAMSGETNKLLALAKEFSASPDPEEMDALVANGENVSIALFSILAKSEGLKARSLQAWQIPILSTDAYMKARIISIDDPETLGQSKLQNANAMSSFGESWRSILAGFANMTTQAVAWNARVQPDHVKFDSTFGRMGRIQAEVAKLKKGAGVARADGAANFPESWNDRQSQWLIGLGGDMMAKIQALDPLSQAAVKEFLPKGVSLPAVESVKKQQSEFDVLLKAKPIPNPAYQKCEAIVAQLEQEVLRGTQEADVLIAQQQPAPPEMQQAMQQATQMLAQAKAMLQQLPPLISSVPVRGDGSENDAVEALACFRSARRNLYSPGRQRQRQQAFRQPRSIAGY